MIHKKYFPIVSLLIALLTLCASCATYTRFLRQDATTSSHDWKRETYYLLHRSLNLPVSLRMQQMPAKMLDVIKNSDLSVGITAANFYSTRSATDAERKLFESYLPLLPPAHQKVLSNKLLGLFLVNDFAGAAYADWVLDDEGNVYYYLIFNTALFKSSMDAWLSYKDNSVFDQMLPQQEIRVTTGTEYKALLYALLHEGAHLVDYELGVTPFVESKHQRVVQRPEENRLFSGTVWQGQSLPLPEFDFFKRQQLNVYGIFPQRGAIPHTDASRMFKELSETPFGSFYAGSNWNEHMADFLTYYHIEQKLGGKVRLSLYKEGKLEQGFSPMQTSVAEKLKPSMSVFYE